MVSGSDWPLDSLRAHHGAQMAYRVSRQEDAVRVEGQAGSRTCVFQTAKPDRAARRLLGDFPRYQLAPALRPPAEIAPTLPAAWD